MRIRMKRSIKTGKESKFSNNKIKKSSLTKKINRTSIKQGGFNGKYFLLKVFFVYSVLLFMSWIFNLYFYDIPNVFVKTLAVFLTILLSSLFVLIFLKHKVGQKIKFTPVLINISIAILFIYLIHNLLLFINGYNLLDIDSYANFPLIIYIALPILAIVFSLIFVNINESQKTLATMLEGGSFFKLLQGFVVYSIVLNSIFISLLVFSRKIIIANGGVIFYALKSALFGFGQKFSIQSILSLTLGNTMISMIVFLSLTLYWLQIAIDFTSSKVVKMFGIFLSIVWLVASLVLALSSYNLFLFWIIVLLVIEFIVFKNYFTNKRFAVKVLFWILGTLVLFILIGAGFWIAKQSIKIGINNLLNLFLAQLLGVLSWGKFLFHVKGFTSLLSIRMYPLFMVLFGYIYGATKNIVNLSSVLGLKISNSYIFNLLAGFGVLGFLFIAYAIYLATKHLIKKHDQISFLLFSIIMSIFFVPLTPFYLIVYIFTFVALFYLVNIKTISFREIKLDKVFYNLGYIFVLFLLLIAYINIDLLKSIHYVNLYEVKSLNSLNKVLVMYKKALQKKDNNSVKANRQTINSFKLNFSKYLYWQRRFSNCCINCEISKLSEFKTVQNLYSISLEYPNLYSTLVNAPNLEAKNQYISMVYNLQKTAWMPTEYKLLGDAWYGLNLTEKVSLYAVRASKNYDRALVFYPLNETILQNYISILLIDYKSALDNNASNEIKAGLEKKIKALLALLQEAGFIKLKTTNNLDVLLNAVVLQAQYYKLTGNEKKAKSVFDSLKVLVNNLKIEKKNKKSILTFIKQVENKVMTDRKQSSNIKLKQENNNLPAENK